MLIGRNGSGKSSFVEAVYLLGRGKSFRTANLRNLIHFESSSLSVGGVGTEALGAYSAFGVQVDRNKTEIKVGGRVCRSRRNLVSLLPTQLIFPGSFALLESGPKHRREFLDWGVFQSDPGFLEKWCRYQRALKQRNALLKVRDARMLEPWDEELAFYGSQIAQARESYVEELKPRLNMLARGLAGLKELDIGHRRGWDQSRQFADLLKIQTEADLRFGFTQYGPHKADLALRVNGRAAREVLSRGETKLLVIALKLAQVELFKDKKGADICILIDDLASELDRSMRQTVLDFFNGLKMQVVITATEGPLLKTFEHYHPTMFHVEHGAIDIGSHSGNHA